MKIAPMVASILLFGCTFSTNNDKLNAITNQKELTREAVAKKHDLVEPIEEEEILGKWKLIASFMTIEMPNGGRGNTILIEDEWIYDIQANGIYHRNNKNRYVALRTYNQKSTIPEQFLFYLNLCCYFVITIL